MARTGRAFPSRRTEHRFAQLLAGFLDATVAVTGTATASINETDVVTGGKTIILTLASDEWVAAGANFDAQRANIAAGIDSAQSEATGWDAVVKVGIDVGDVVRTSATVVTITLDPEATYDITATETITVTVPSTALLTNLVAVVGSPTFTVSAVGASSALLLRLQTEGLFVGSSL